MAGENAATPRLLTIALTAVLAMVAYELYAGVALKKIGIPGVLELELADKPGAAAQTPSTTSAPTTNSPITAASVAPAVVATQPAPSARPALTRESFGGRWHAQRSVGGYNEETVVDYHNDGTFSGWDQQFVGGYGQRVPTQGRWNVEILSPDTFRLTVSPPSGYPSQAMVFRMLDQDHVQNVLENYVAERVR
jgi:hypothetical protein